MDAPKIYDEDLKIARGLIDRNEAITRTFFYKTCYPLFKSIYNNYHTDCSCCKEFIDEIYVLVLSPNRSNGKCQLENYQGQSSLPTWLKTVCLFYCYRKFEAKNKMPIYEPIYTPFDSDSNEGDRFDNKYGSISIDLDKMVVEDILKILAMMPNKRYAKVLELRYIMDMTNEEIAEALGLNMDCYYNVHKRAKTQFKRICGKEGLYE